MQDRTALTWILCLAGFTVSFPAVGQSSREKSPSWRYSVTPFIGWRQGGDFDFQSSDMDADVNAHISGALALGMRVDEESAYEIFFSRQTTSLDGDAPLAGQEMEVQYLHFGGTLITLRDAWLEPYIAGGLGVTTLDLKAPGSNADSTFSISLAGGVHVPVSTHLDIRLEARAFLTFLSSDSSVFCGSSEAGGACALHSSGTAFHQYELLAGVTYRF